MKNLWKAFTFQSGRKFGFGLWLSFVSTAFFAGTMFLGKQGFTAENWLFCISVSGVLVGGGTVADSWLKIKGGENVPTA